MSENEYKYHDTVLDLEAKVKENENVMLKIGHSLQAMFMPGPEPMSFYDSNLKHGLGYTNPYTLKKAISHNLKLYDASCFSDSKICVNVRDTEDILDDATKNVRAENQDLLMTITELKTKLKIAKKGLSAASSVRRPLNRDSPLKNNVLSNTKKSSKKVEVSVRINKKTYVAFNNVVSNKNIVTDGDV
ncbi:hypothetical protein Tco_1193472 [Tanacetum coccineum]